MGKVTYSVVAKKDWKNEEGGNKFYAQAQVRCEMGLREMTERIQQMCTVTRADAVAVLVALSTAMREGLCNGEIVRLGDLGSFRIGLHGAGSDTEEEYHTGLIKRAVIKFTPGADLVDILGSLSYERVAVKERAKA